MIYFFYEMRNEWKGKLNRAEEGQADRERDVFLFLFLLRDAHQIQKSNTEMKAEDN